MWTGGSRVSSLGWYPYQRNRYCRNHFCRLWDMMRSTASSLVDAAVLTSFGGYSSRVAGGLSLGNSARDGGVSSAVTVTQWMGTAFLTPSSRMVSVSAVFLWTGKCSVNRWSSIARGAPTSLSAGDCVAFLVRLTKKSRLLCFDGRLNEYCLVDVLRVPGLCSRQTVVSVPAHREQAGYHVDP